MPVLDETRVPESAERQRMKNYWKVYSPTLESMMLNDDAIYLAENEQNELLSYLPSYKGKRVLELGAGIGRFTSRFALLAHHVTAVDFIESYVEENRKTNEHHNNVAFQCADVTKLEFEENSFDLVFTNWLFMYLTNPEVEKTFAKILKWLTPNGHFFIRESCYHQSGNVKRPENPTKYRTPLDYFNMFLECTYDKNFYNIKFAKNILAYVLYYGNPNQLCILVEKKSGKRKSLERHFSDTTLAQRHHQILGPILRESGPNSIKSIGTKLGVRGGQKVLLLGCGLSEAAVKLVESFNCFVHGVDTSVTKVHTAIERQGKLPLDIRKKIQYEYCNESPSIWTLPVSSYEAIVCLDIHHRVTDGHLVIEKLKESLKDGGKIFISDYLTNDYSANSKSDEIKVFMGRNELNGIVEKESLRIDLEEDATYEVLLTLKKRRSEALSQSKEIPPLFTELDNMISEMENGNLKHMRYFVVSS